MQLASRTSRWEAIPTRQNPRFPRNVHRARRDPPKLARRHSSQRDLPASSLKQLQNEYNENVVVENNNGSSSKRRFDRKGQNIIVVRRSTNTTACSEITFDSGYFSVETDFDEDYDDDDISEEASLVDDDDDEEDSVTEAITTRPTKAQSPQQGEDEDDDDDCDIPVPRILIFGLEPRRASPQVHPTRLVTDAVSEHFGDESQNNKNVRVDTAVILTETTQLDDDNSRDTEYILAMASIKKNIQRTTSQPDAVIVITADSDTPDITLEGFHADQEAAANTKVFSLLDSLRSHEIPVCAKPRYGPEICRQWSDRLQKAGLSTPPPIIFFHLPQPSSASETTNYLKPETSAKGVSIAVAALARRLTTRKSVAAHVQR